MAKYDAREEERLRQGVAIYQATPHVKVATIARQVCVPAWKLRARLRGVPPSNTKGGQNKALTSAQEQSLGDFIRFLISCGHQATPDSVVVGANTVLLLSHSTRLVDRQWGTRWLKRNPFKTLRAKTLAQERKLSHSRKDLEAHFDGFRKACEQYGVCEKDIYNMDETGFRVGCISGKVVITSLNTKAVYLADPDNRESLTAVETICADGSTIAPMIILKGMQL